MYVNILTICVFMYTMYVFFAKYVYVFIIVYDCMCVGKYIVFTVYVCMYYVFINNSIKHLKAGA